MKQLKTSLMNIRPVVVNGRLINPLTHPGGGRGTAGPRPGDWTRGQTRHTDACVHHVMLTQLQVKLMTLDFYDQVPPEP